MLGFNPILGADGSNVAKKRRPVRVPMCKRARLLQELGTRLLRANGDPARVADVERRCRSPFPEYGCNVRYDGRGPVLGPLDEETQAAIDAQLDTRTTPSFGQP